MDNRQNFTGVDIPEIPKNTDESIVQAYASYDDLIPPSMGNIGSGFVKPKGQTLYKDTYSNKYYGSVKYDELVRNAEAAKGFYSNYIRENSNPLGGFVEHNSLGGKSEPGDMEKRMAASLASIFVPDEADYVYQERMDDSFRVYGDDWKAFWKGNYENPRLAEEAQNRASRQDLGIESNRSRNSVSNDNTPERVNVNTGISSQTLSPFGGTVEAGLGI